MPPNTSSTGFTRPQTESDSHDPAAVDQTAKEAAESPGSPDSQANAETVALHARNAELEEECLRAQADLQNVRRRAAEEVAKARKFSIETFADSLLPVIDSLEAGLGFAEASASQIREGAEATLRQLKSALERNKVIEVAPAVGSRFDPHLHQAVSVTPVPGQMPNTIVSVLQKGYTIADRVLRPALVTVSSAS